MAAKLEELQIRELIARADAARNHLANTAEVIRAKLDAPARVRASLRSHPTAWLAGAAATGLVASRLLFRRRPQKNKLPKSHASVPLFIIKMVSNAAMPAVKIWLLAQAKSWLNRRTTEPDFIQHR